MDREARLDLQPLWHRCSAGEAGGPALGDPWGVRHRPDWAERGLILWPRGGQWCHLRLSLSCPAAWRSLPLEAVRARLALRWWADRAELWVDGACVHTGDLFDTSCRWELPGRWWEGRPLEVELRLRSPLHDDGALIHSHVDAEPTDPGDPLGLLDATRAALAQLRHSHGRGGEPGPGGIHVLGHAHLDLAWLWPVADTWQAAERTFRSALALMERHGDLHFAHSTPALYAWLEIHRPALFQQIRAAMRAGRWEPINGPWVETDCVLIATASLLRQFEEGQRYSRRAFPEWRHTVAWLPDSFGFAAGLPAAAAAHGVRWFCTHKLAWNATNPFPHRLFRWRSRCGAEVLALMTAPIGTDGDPLAIEKHRLEWQRATGRDTALWLPGVGDHGGGPTEEMLDQLALWNGQAAAAPQRHGTLRAFLEALEPLADRLPVWRDELYLELHRGCATSRPDQKRHNRTLERLLREAELARALLGAAPPAEAPPPASVSAHAHADAVDGGAMDADAIEVDAIDWRPLLFQQFHDILPGTSIPEVFEQAEPQWRTARRRARRQRDHALQLGLAGRFPRPRGDSGAAARRWWVVQLEPGPPGPRTVRLPAGSWSLAAPSGPIPLAGQPAAGGGEWLQLPALAGVCALGLLHGAEPAAAPAGEAGAGEVPPAPLQHPVRLEPAADAGSGRWRLGNGLLSVLIGPRGVEQLWDAGGVAQLAEPLRWCRWGDRGAFWDAWDIADDHRSHPLPWLWEGDPEWIERGPLCARFRWRGRCGGSALRLDGRLLAGTPWLELTLSLDWRQRHELLRLEIPLARFASRWAADTSGGVLERPAEPLTPRERSRWEVAAISWLAAVPAEGAGGLAVLLDGPQGVDAGPERLGISLLRAPTWPDPGADNGRQRQRLALMPCPGGWRPAGVPSRARSFRAPLWCRPALEPAAPPGRPEAGGAEGGREGAGLAEGWPGLPPLADDLALLGLRPVDGGAPGAALLTVQNLGPCRRTLTVGPRWRVLRRLPGPELRQGADGGPAVDPAPDPLRLEPWQIGFWLLARG